MLVVGALMATQVPALQTRQCYAFVTSHKHTTPARSLAPGLVFLYGKPFLRRKSAQQQPFGSLQSFAVLPLQQAAARRGWLVRVAPLLLHRQRGSAGQQRCGWWQSASQRIRLQGMRMVVIDQPGCLGRACRCCAASLPKLSN